MSSTLSTSFCPVSQPGLNYESVKQFLESDSTLTNNRYDRDQWDDFYGTENSEQSKETQPTKSSFKIVNDDNFSTVIEKDGQQYELPKPILGKAQYTPLSKYSPSHYQRGKIEVWDFIVDQGLDYLAGNVVKYVCRAGHKSHESELDDWLKVKAYVERKIKALS